jgi:hypothetical protein
MPSIREFHDFRLVQEEIDDEDERKQYREELTSQEKGNNESNKVKESKREFMPAIEK